MGTNILICGSAKISKKKLYQAAIHADYIVAADGGYDSLMDLKIKPDFLLGDMDSIVKVPNDIKMKNFPKDKNISDLEIAISFVLSKFNNVKNLTITGAVSEKRMDHTFSNLLQFSNQKINIELISQYSTLWFLNKRGYYTFQTKPFSKVSIIQIKKGEIFGEGLKFKLPKNLNSFTHGISNESICKSFNLNIKSGKWVIVIFDKNQK